MRLYVDLDTLAISDLGGAPLAVLRAKRSDRFALEVRFVRGGVVQELPFGAMGRVVVKRSADFSGYPIAWAPKWRKLGFGARAYYSMNLNLHTEQVVDQFITLSGELASISAAFEIQWEHRGARRTSQTVLFVIENDYVRLADEEEVPIAVIDPSTTPVISLIGASVMNVSFGSVFVDPGAIVTDNYDVPRTIFGEGSVNTASVGGYTLTYRAVDAAENQAVPVTRSVIVSDVTAPVITLIGANPFYVNVGVAFVDPGANVTDNRDVARVIAGVVVQVPYAVDTASPGAYTLTYSATDAAGNVAAPVTRSVIVRDVVAPVIALIGADPLIVSLNSVFVDPGANVTDDVDVARVIAGAGSVDTSILGATYTLTYSATDAAGNVATPVTRSVIVNDLVAPVIALIGANPVNLNVGDVFTDDGANVTDDVDAARVISGVGPVNAASPGTYTLTYSATDAAGNVATPVTRSVIVSDVVAPVIALIGVDPVNLNVGDVFTDDGANVTDDVDAAKVISGVGAVNMALPGTYTLTYSATDAAGNVATPVTRSVIVSDVVAPVITLIGADPLIVSLNSVFVDPGANVTDDVDAARVIAGAGSVDTSILGATYTLTYSATDAAGNAATPVTRSVIVNDLVAPVIALIGANPVNLNVGDVFADAGANVTDDVDAAKVISGVGAVNMALPGVYTLTYSATDAAGNVATSVTRSVIVSDVVAPVITLIGVDPVNLNVGDVFTDAGANVTDDVDAAKVISGVGAVNMALPGTYTLTYSATDAAGNVATPVTRSVIVSDVVAPVITLIGADPLIVSLNSVFVDPGANVTDDVDAARVIAGAGSVDASILGATYTLTYSATDAAGNAATPVTRSVIVSDVVAPVITLVGANPLIVPLNSVFVDPGANVTDDVSFVGVGHQISGTGTVDASILGTYTLTYSVADAAGNVATPVTRSVIVSDVVAPVITLIGADPVNLNVGDVFTDAGANVRDDVDAAKVILGAGLVNAAAPGTYTLTYSATDAAGNVATSVTRSVIVSDVVAPVITLIGADPVNLNVGDVFTDAGANVTDDVDAARMISGTVLSPTLVFKGSYDNGYAYAYNDAVLYFGKFYYRHSNPSNPGYPPDPSVTANASWTMVTDIVDTSVAGTYVLTYAATDAAGNAAAPVTRSVIVS